MRRFFGGMAMVITIGAAAVALWTGVGRATGPAPVAPLSERVMVFPALESPAASPPAVVATPVSGPTWSPDEVAAPMVDAPAASVVVSCATGADGAFVEVAGAGDCPGSAAMRIEATATA